MLSVLAAGFSSLMSILPAGATGFHCPGTPGSSNTSFAYMSKDGSKASTGASTPAKAFADFLRTGSDGLHFPKTEWTHPSKNLFVYNGIHGNIQVTTLRTQRGTYLVTQAKQNCSTL
jgi:hypothetical protein